MPDESPIRLCCGQRHDGPICPDGKVMCQLCFKRVEIKDLNVVPKHVGEFSPESCTQVTHIREDVCKSCAEAEAR